MVLREEFDLPTAHDGVLLGVHFGDDARRPGRFALGNSDCSGNLRAIRELCEASPDRAPASPRLWATGEWHSR